MVNQGSHAYFARSPTMTKRCACCGQRFHPRPQVPGQTYCSAPDCQRARKRQWQRDKLRSDPDYRLNQRAAQQAWAQRNRGYWQRYRNARQESITTGAEPGLLGGTDTPQAPSDKMDAWSLPPGLYLLTKHPACSSGMADSWVVDIRPLRQTSFCRMGASREDMLDTSPACP